MKSFKKIVAELLKMIVSKEEVVVEGGNNLKDEIVIIPDTSVKRQKQIFEKPTFEKVEDKFK